ncbi:MAG: NAD(P)-dependent oxidoreductase [Flavobacteriales bacterium]
MKIGIIKEGKVPADKRVPFTPQQCREIKNKFGVEVVVQSSEVRSFPDEMYVEQGIKVVSDISDCDVLFGVKEVPVEELLPGKTYFFFSHTIKKQPHNKKLMKALLEKKISMVDYECLTYANGDRIIGFGRFAGIVGTYNALLAYGRRYSIYDLKPAHLCVDRAELEKELKKVKLPPIKIVFTGGGRVANGTLEILNTLGLRNVTPEEILSTSFDEPVYSQLHGDHYYHRKDDGRFNMEEMVQHPERYRSVFPPYTKVADIYIPCHFWSPKGDVFFTREDMVLKDFRIKVIADITCDINGSVPSTIRSSTIAEPLYGFNPVSGKEVGPFDSSAVTVMAVDNLPCELPRDASADFGAALIEKVLPGLLSNDPDQIIERATICKGGSLMEKFSYLKDYTL